MSITASPVDTLTVSGSFSGVPVGMSMDGSVSNHVGSFSKSVPAGTYNIVVTGIANGSPSSVSMTVSASQPQNVGSDGKYTASISTSGLPSTVYTVTQGSTVVAMVYLGVAAPATPAPSATPTPTPSPSANATQVTSPGTLSGNDTNMTGNMTNGTAPTVSAIDVANGSPSSATTSGNSGGMSPWIMAILAISCGTIIGVVAAYLFLIRKK